MIACALLLGNYKENLKASEAGNSLAASYRHLGALETVNDQAEALCESPRSFVSDWSREEFGRINLETNVLPIPSAQSSKAGGGVGERKEERKGWGESFWPCPVDRFHAELSAKRCKHTKSCRDLIQTKVAQIGICRAWMNVGGTKNRD